MQHRILLPLFFQRLDSKPPEQLLLPLEIGIQCADEHTFPESPRAAQEIIAPGLYKFIYLLCLVYVTVPVFTEFLEILYFFDSQK